MKWGVRKDKKKVGKISTSLNKKLKKKSSTNTVKQLSDEELRKRLSRLNMEKQYKELTKKNKSKGRKFVESVISASAKTVATKYVSKYFDNRVAEILIKLKK